MKKIISFLLLLVLIFSLNACGDSDSNNAEDVQTPSVTEPQTNVENPSTEVVDLNDGYQNSFVQTETNYQHIELDKEIYSLTDDLVINIFDAATTDFVAVFDMNGEPGGPGTSHYKRNKVSGKTQITFSIESMGLIPGEYCVCLYQNGTMFLYDRVVFKVSDGDATDYQVENAKLNFTNTNGYRTSSVTITPSADKELTYKFYWAKDGVRLDGYSYIDTVVKKSSKQFTVNFKDNMYMPRDANQVEIYVLEGTSTSYFIDVDSSFELKKSKYLFNFQVFSDIHSDIDEKAWNSHFKTALIDVMRLSGNSSAIFAVGDLTNFGSQTCYELLDKTLTEYIPEDGPKFYAALGNHEYQYYTSKGFETARDYYFDQIGINSIYYSVEIEGLKFIVLGSESLDKAGYMSEEQLNWFKNEMSKVDKNKPTFVFFHQPFANTLSGMDSGLEAGGFENVREEMMTILKEHPNTYAFSGHTHMTYETDKTAVFGKGKDANYVNTGAIAYLNDLNYNEIVGSLGLFVEVYEDYVMINGRNFYTGEWVSEALFVSPIYTV